MSSKQGVESGFLVAVPPHGVGTWNGSSPDPLYLATHPAGDGVIVVTRDDARTWDTRAEAEKALQLFDAGVPASFIFSRDGEFYEAQLPDRRRYFGWIEEVKQSSK